MKTIRLNTPANCALALLATIFVAGAAHAEETGRARVSDFGTQDEATASDTELIVRGASDLRSRNARTSAALRSLFRVSSTRQVSMSCDGCVPFTPGCADDGCLANACCPTTGGSCAPGCNCPSGGPCCCPGNGVSCAAPGRCRLSDACSACDGMGCSACGTGCDQYGSCSHGYCGDCPICNSGSCLNSNCIARFLSTQAVAHRARNRLASANLNQYLHCKFGYFIHDGNGGVGSPLFGHYSVVYPVDPGASDARDGQVYAAQGYGGAVSVPLAPVVRQAYNYGWGVPSSRLTPISNQMAP